MQSHGLSMTPVSIKQQKIIPWQKSRVTNEAFKDKTGWQGTKRDARSKHTRHHSKAHNVWDLLAIIPSTKEGLTSCCYWPSTKIKITSQEKSTNNWMRKSLHICWSVLNYLQLKNAPQPKRKGIMGCVDMVSSCVGQYSTLEYQQLFWVVSNLYLNHIYHVREKTLVKRKHVLSPPNMRALL